MKEYCVDLEIAKQLKTNGFPQVNIEYYHQTTNTTIQGENYLGIKHKSDISNEGAFFTYSAPTTDEILKELPKVIIKNSEYYYLNVFRDVFNVVNPNFSTNYYNVSYIDHNNKCLNAPENFSPEEDKSSHALAMMWLYLKGRVYENMGKKGY